MYIVWFYGASFSIVIHGMVLECTVLYIMQLHILLYFWIVLVLYLHSFILMGAFLWHFSSQRDFPGL